MKTATDTRSIPGSVSTIKDPQLCPVRHPAGPLHLRISVAALRSDTEQRSVVGTDALGDFDHRRSEL